MNSINRKAVRAGVTLMLITVFIIGCEEENLPIDETIQLKKAEQFTLSSTATYIDLKSLVSTTQSVQLSVLSQPTNGKLTTISKGVLEYLPAKDFKNGQDFFRFAVYNQSNKLLAEDTVVITVSEDPAVLPCGLYAASDYARSYDGENLIIDVLGNDLVCDSIQAVLHINDPIEAAPIHGVAQLIDNKIKYFPKAGYVGVDSFFYKIASATDTSRYAYGKVRVLIQPEEPVDPNFVPNNDTYMISRDSLGINHYLTVFSNDYLPGDRYAYSSSLIGLPHYGEATDYSWSSVIYKPSTALIGKTDSITYQVCKGSICKTAKVYINTN
jgi:hypothetical protein